ncbi:MAG TPA: hypothetical protein VEX57_14545 [Microlunatus sp.]|nr:hypothetical protein [Microlunatus sp.]
MDAPKITDRPLRDQVSPLDQTPSRGDDLEAESRLALVVDRLGWHPKGRPVRPEPAAAVRSPVVPASRAGIRLRQVPDLPDLPDPEQHEMSPRTRRAAQH